MAETPPPRNELCSATPAATSGCASCSRMARDQPNITSRSALTRRETRSCMEGARGAPLFDDRDLRRLDLEGLELAGASLWILGRDRVANDTERRVLRNDPLGHPELPLR